MELTACRLVVVALSAVLATCLVSSDAQRIVSFPSSAGYETNRRDKISGEEFPRREELLEALDFLEEYERAKANDWNKGANAGGRDVYGLEDNDVYPSDFDAAGDDLMQKFNGLQEYPGLENRVDTPPWLGEYLQPHADASKEYPGTREDQEEGALPGEITDEELRQMVYEEMVQAYEEMVEADEDAIADAVEREEELIADNILEDVWAQDVLEQDAEKQLKWLIAEEDEKMRREDEAEEEDLQFLPPQLKNPFQFESSSYSDGEDVSESSVSDELGWRSFLESSSEEQDSGYVSSNQEEEGDSLEGDSLEGDDAEKDDLGEEEEEILKNLQEKEEQMEKELKADRLLEALADTLVKEAIQEENEEEEEDEDSVGEDEGESSSVVDAGMIADDSNEEQQKQRVIEDEVYQELLEFLKEEIDQAIGDVAEDIVQALDEEEQLARDDQTNYEDLDIMRNPAADTNEENPDLTSTLTGVEPENDVCSTLEYFVDNCDIVNNYGDLGADGYKDLFTGPCNRHQLCYACGEYYDVGSKLCDELLKAEMLSLCTVHGDPDCEKRAKYFWLVARNNRIPEVESSPLCADRCILNSLVEA